MLSDATQGKLGSSSNKSIGVHPGLLPVCGKVKLGFLMKAWICKVGGSSSLPQDYQNQVWGKLPIGDEFSIKYQQAYEED